MAAPWDHTLETSKKQELYYVNIDRTKTKQKTNLKKRTLADEIFSHFLRFQVDLCLQPL